jgi:hypothetical protein
MNRWIAVVGAVGMLAAMSVGCSAADDQQPEPQVLEEGLTLDEATPERIAGRFKRESSWLSFDVRTKDGAPLLTIKDSAGRTMVQTHPVGADAREMSIYDGRVRYSAKMKPSQAPSEALSPSLESQKLPTEPVLAGDEAAMHEMIQSKDAQTLPYLSRALGERGITGKDYPVSFPIHGLAMLIARAHEIDVPALPDTVASRGDLRAQGGRCHAYPNAGSGCYGMCGRGCSCWGWVCGDCCYHRGCAAHDNDCRSCSWRNPGACARCASFSSFWTNGRCG